MAGTVMTAAVPAWAGEEPLYQPAPAWVAEATLPEVKSGPPVLVLDDQQRIDQGRLWSYTDRAIRIDNPQMMTALGTLQAGWLPDKGDLIVHRVAILRDGQQIDLLEGGSRFEVLRRERRLEQRMLDGAFTATMSIPGMRVGDVLRVSYSVTKSDQVLDEEVQTMSPLLGDPFQAKFARVRYSWPGDATVQWRAGQGAEVREFKLDDSFSAVEVMLPLPKAPDMPDDAPVRYRMPALLQAGTFADWAEVSRVMAPHYGTEGAIAPGSPVAAEVRKIEQAHQGKIERAVAALRLVQDEIAYLMNGLNGGNYKPQAPAETWEFRYGDCKAKSLLLLAMLRELGIEAEAVLVASQTGDGVPGMLPMAGVFDHVIVRATIDGTDYWLDGTTSGASMATVMVVPPFHHALPLRMDGADLMPLAPRPQQALDVDSRVTLDQRAGLDVPQLFEGEWTVAGGVAGILRGLIGQGTEEQLRDVARAFVAEQMGDVQVFDTAITFDPDTNTARVQAKGLMTSAWKWERGRGKRGFDLPTAGFTFQPDRTRAAWRDIPVAIDGPYSARAAVTALLPDGSDAYRIEGKSAIDETIASIQLHRNATLDRNTLTIVDSTRWPGGEISPDVARTERSKATRFGSTELNLVAPATVPRRSDLANMTDRRRYAPIEAAYQTLIEADPEDTDAIRNRLTFRLGTYDRLGALEDINAIIEREPSAEHYLQRSYIHAQLARMDEALSDAEAAWELAPNIAATGQRAELLRYFDRAEESIGLLQEQGGNADEQRTLSLQIGDLEAQLGRKEEGLARIDEMLTQRPGDPDLMNAKCWYQAIWNYRTEDMLETCTQAVESANWSPAALDSRAMAYHRLGRNADALKDLEAALAANPDLSAALLMRGVVKRELGDQSGRDDIRKALFMSPAIERAYKLYGIKLN
ncbi:DUF3857 domain-containing protein [Croceibacterium xixiisoli]|nr:DUF3857 domain-containing protein [Croceibacterium xixiisoli]